MEKTRKTTDAQLKANARYDAVHTRQIKMKLNLTTDRDILEHLDKMENKQGYIKRLIREDMLRTR